ncbi:MAG: OFA family MFS transporter [Dehalococcoidales bacterium]|nr:OFA family MFS transporter [Dehalococcoidales bacterium]
MVGKSDAPKVFGMKAEAGRWLFVVLGLLIQLCLGAVYAWGTFKKPIMTHFQLNATQGNLPFILFLASFAILMPFGGRWIQKYGPRKIGIIAGILVGIGWILAGFATNLATLCLTYGFIAGAGVGLAYGAPIQVSTRWFPDRRGLAVGLTVGGFGLSAAAISPIGNALISTHDVTFMFKIFGIVFLVLTVLLALALKFPAANWKPAGWKGPKAGAAVAQNFTSSQMFKTPSFWALFLCFIFGSTAGLMAIGMASPVGQEIIKLNAATAAILTSVFAIFNFVGRPIFGWLTDRIKPNNAAVVSFVLIALGSAGMLFLAGEGTVAVYTISFVFLWMALGGWLAVAPTATVTFFGPVNNSGNYGIVFIAYGLGAIIGNLVSGRAKDLFGNYNVAFTVTLILAIIGLVLAAIMLKAPQKAPDSK